MIRCCQLAVIGLACLDRVVLHSARLLRISPGATGRPAE